MRFSVIEPPPLQPQTPMRVESTQGQRPIARAAPA